MKAVERRIAAAVMNMLIFIVSVLRILKFGLVSGTCRCWFHYRDPGELISSFFNKVITRGFACYPGCNAEKPPEVPRHFYETLELRGIGGFLVSRIVELKLLKHEILGLIAHGDRS